MMPGQFANVFPCLLLISTCAVGIAGDPACDSGKSRMERAGNANCIAPWARCSKGQYQIGYYVGGGAFLHHGEPRYSDEGVWGVDSKPVVPGFRQANVLFWWHGPPQQGGSGAYEPDAPNHPFSNFRQTKSAKRSGSGSH